MVADDLEYGWYKWENGFRQKDGLFTDRSGKVIYWPDAEGPGYILDDATAEKIGECKKREIEEEDGEKARAEFYRVERIIGRKVVGPGLGKLVGATVGPIIAAVAIIGIIALIAKLASSSRGGDAGSQEGATAPSDAAAEPAEDDEVDLSRYPQVAGPRPAVRDDLVVAKAAPDLLFFIRCLWSGALAASALWLFGLLMLHWGWNSAGDKFWGIVFSLVLILFALGTVGSAYDGIRLRYAPLTLDGLVSRIKVRDGLTLPKLAREKDSALEVDIPEELQRHEDANTRRMRDFERL